MLVHIEIIKCLDILLLNSIQSLLNCGIGCVFPGGSSPICKPQPPVSGARRLCRPFAPRQPPEVADWSPTAWPSSPRPWGAERPLLITCSVQAGPGPCWPPPPAAQAPGFRLSETRAPSSSSCLWDRVSPVDRALQLHLPWSGRSCQRGTQVPLAPQAPRCQEAAVLPAAHLRARCLCLRALGTTSSHLCDSLW